MKLYWYAKWGLPDDIERQRRAGSLILSNDRMEQNMAAVYEKGKKDSALEHERAGVLLFGREVRGLLDQRTGVKHVPVWELEKLLSEWNVPPNAKPEDAERDSL